MTAREPGKASAPGSCKCMCSLLTTACTAHEVPNSCRSTDLLFEGHFGRLVTVMIFLPATGILYSQELVLMKSNNVVKF